MPTKKLSGSQVKTGTVRPSRAAKKSPATKVTPENPIPTQADSSASNRPISSDRERVPADVPSIYADQVMDILYGTHTSKVVLGFENGGGTRMRPVGVVIIPTAFLLIAAQKIIENLSVPAMVEETATRYASVLRLMHEGSASAKGKGDQVGIPPISRTHS